MRRSGELSAPQRSLLEIMREHQFGRVENMSIRAGQPVVDRDLPCRLETTPHVTPGARAATETHKSFEML